jgi:hypothetical protein
MSSYTFNASDVHGNGLDAPLSSAGGWWSLLERVAGDLTDGRRGRMATEALIGSGLAPDAASIRRKYEANKGVLDRYFDEIDEQRLFQMARSASADTATDAATKAAWLGAAYVAGIATMHVLNRRNK